MDSVKQETTPGTFERLREVCSEEGMPRVEEGLAWADLCQGPDGIARSMRAVRRFIQAVRLGHFETRPFSEMREYFKPDWPPHLSPALDALLASALEANHWASREGYAHDLCHMSRGGCRGQEHPCGWVPFVCIIGGRARGLVTGMCPFPDPSDDRVVFATLGEVMAFVTDGPEDELDEGED
jgi:hypothetical protein